MQIEFNDDFVIATKLSKRYMVLMQAKKKSDDKLGAFAACIKALFYYPDYHLTSPTGTKINTFVLMLTIVHRFATQFCYLQTSSEG